MIESVFVAIFVLLPLAAAVLFLLYRARFFVRNMLIVVVLAIGVWGALKLASSDFELFPPRAAVPAQHQPVSCFSTPDREPVYVRDCQL
ncbi:MAG: hypothetical protein AB7N54_02830 [Alphaproteobacteria bacterium]